MQLELKTLQNTLVQPSESEGLILWLCRPEVFRHRSSGMALPLLH
jgi:hypothetical protein